MYVLSLTGQVGGIQNAYYAMATRSYGIEDGMPDKCVGFAFVDTSGRLNIIPCTYVQAGQEMYLYQYDGRSSYRQDVPVVMSQGQWAIVPCHTSADGTISGYLTEGLDRSTVSTGCFRYHPDAEKWELISAPAAGNTEMQFRNVSVYDGDMYTLGVTAEALLILRYHSGGWEEHAKIPATSFSGPARLALPFYVDGQSFLIGEWNGTVHRVNRKDGSIRTIKASDLNLLGAGQSAYILALPDGAFLQCAPGNGVLYRLDFSRQKRHVFLPPMDTYAHKSGTMHYAYEDQAGNLLFISFNATDGYRGWLLRSDDSVWQYTDVLSGLPVTEEDGLRFHHLTSKDFTRSLYVVGNDFVSVDVASRGAIQAVHTGAVRGVIELADSSLVFAMGLVFDGNGVQLSDKEAFACFDQMQSNGDIVRDGPLYIYGVRGVGVYSYDTRSGTCTTVLENPGIQRIAVDSTGWIYMLVLHKMMKTDPATGKSLTVVDSAIRSFVNEIFISRSNDVYVASSDGLTRVDSVTRSLVPVRPACLQETEPVLSVYEDHSGRLWLGTHSSGLILYHPKTGACASMTTEDGLSNNIVASTIEDTDADIWVGTYHGITIFDQDANIRGYVYEESGLVDNECNRWAADVLSDGRLYFGSPKGFSLIDPGVIKKQIREREPLRIYPTMIETNGQRYLVGDNAFAGAFTGGITIPAHNRSLRIGYALSSYASPESNRFAYRLDLPGSTWNFIGALYTLSLSDLPPGQYRLFVKGTDFQGRISSNVISLPLTVNQYFYKTWWFYALCALPFIVFAFLWWHRQRDEWKRLESEVRKRTQTIREQTEALRELDEHKNRMYTNITHEFRTPLTVIMGLADQLDLDERAPEMISRNAGGLLNLVNQMLDLSKLESGKLSYEPVQGDIIPYLQYIGESFRSIAEVKSLKFHFLPDRSEIIMDYDPEKLSRVVGNLVSNAIKFTPAGGDIYLQVEGGRIVEGILEIRVIDTGIGIPEGQLGKIFDRFYQVDDSHIRKGEGTGIGLTLVSEFVKLMGGTIGVRSKPGAGTTFVVSLPITHMAERETQIRIPHTHLDAAAGMHQPLVDHSTEETATGIERHVALIVEDNPDVVHYIGSCLRDTYHLLVAIDGQEGIEKALELIPDIIVSDIMMPVKDGFELCETLKNDARTSHIPIILLTAKADFESRLQGLTRGADAYLAKPFDKDELLIRIAKLIEQREVLRKRYTSGAFPLSPSSDPDVQIEDAFITKVNQVLIDNVEKEDFGIDDLSAAIHLGRTQLHSKLKALTGKSTGLYIRAVRIAESVRFLENPDYNISEVAYAVGFSDPKYFARTFKQEFGMTPSEWREKATETRQDFDS